MRLARFAVDGDEHFGVVTDGGVHAVDHRLASFEALVADPADGAARRSDPRWDADAVTWLAPFAATAKIICVGLNYASHAVETARPTMSYPTLFPRFPDSFVGHGQALLRGRDGPALDWEGEAGLVIGALARRVTPQAAMNHVAGFTCMAENSERDWQQHAGQVTAGKNWFGSGSCGPWITTIDELEFPLRVTTRLNDAVVQDDTTDHLTFGVADIISYVSTFTPLRPGDVIATGTPAGVGVRRVPPRYLRPGDRLEVAVSGVGVLRNTVVDDTTVSASPIPSHPLTVGGTP